EVESDGEGAAAAGFNREVAGAAAEIEHHRPGSKLEHPDRPAAPGAVHPERHQAVHEVVARRDAIEHRSDERGLLGAVRQSHYHRTLRRRSEAARLATSSARSSLA